MTNYGNQDKQYKLALATKKKREGIVKGNKPYPCTKCGIEKYPDEFVIQYISNQQVGKYRYLYECKACKKQRTYERRAKKRSTLPGALEIIIKHLYQGAKKRNLSFAITTKDLQLLRDRQHGCCYYSGYEMQYTFVGFNDGHLHEKSKYQVSCDRLDNTKGYTKDNIVLCCTFVNKMKGSLDEQEFYQVCKDIIKTQKK